MSTGYPVPFCFWSTTTSPAVTKKHLESVQDFPGCGEQDADLQRTLSGSDEALVFHGFHGTTDAWQEAEASGVLEQAGAGR